PAAPPLSLHDALPIFPGAGDTTRTRLDALTELAKGWGAKGLVWMRVLAGELESPVAKFLSEQEKAALRLATDAEAGDLLLIVAEDRKSTRLNSSHDQI